MKRDKTFPMNMCCSRMFLFLMAVSMYLSCSMNSFDIAGNPSDIGNSQDVQAMNSPSDTCASESDAIVIDVVKGRIYRAGEEPLLP